MPLLQVPFFLRFWSIGLFGEWMILSAIPAYLTFSNIGFGSVAYNEMNISISAGERDRALAVFQSCWWLIIIVGVAIGIFFSIALYFLPISGMLGLKEVSNQDAKFAILSLGYSVLLSQLEQLVGSAYTCVGRYPYGAFLKQCLNIMTFLATLLAVTLHQGVRNTALVVALANLVGTIYLCIAVRRDIPWINYGWQYASWTEIRRLTRPALAFMGFPLGNAFNLQGSLLAVGYALGPSSVVIFSTTRTVSRVALQFLQMINITVWPEMSSAYGANNWSLIRALHRRSCQIVVALSVPMVATLLVFGPWVLNHWTDGRVAPNRILLSVLLIVAALNTLWSTSSTLAVAVNKHQTLASYYIIATAITLATTYLGAQFYGLYGAAASLLVSEIIMNSYVLPHSLSISQDRLSTFLASIIEVPSMFELRNLLKRLSGFCHFIRR